MKKAALEPAGSPASETQPACGALCETCRKKKSADVFAAAFGERV
jgi:hypothetical protein